VYVISEILLQNENGRMRPLFHVTDNSHIVALAQAGIQVCTRTGNVRNTWVPACAGTTVPLFTAPPGICVVILRRLPV
jgi:hypothetical protein